MRCASSVTQCQKSAGGFILLQLRGGNLLPLDAEMQSANVTNPNVNASAYQMQARSYRRVLPWLGFVCIALIYVVAIVRLGPTSYFGMSEDDSIYFSSAKALSEGKGYILPSIPGAPPATKYPILYPWLLSWVWRWNPSFPANLADAVAVTLAFGLGYISLTFSFLRRLKGIGEAEALFLTAFCALHPIVLLYSSSVLSDIPFAAVALGAMLIADGAIRREGNNLAAACSAVLVGLSILLRVFGVPVAAGIFVAGVVRRAWRQLFIFCGCVTPFFAALAWRIVFPRVVTPPAISKAGASSLGWTLTWAYYTSYLSVWQIGFRTRHIFWTMLGNNALSVLLRGPANYFLFPGLVRDTPVGRVLVVLITVAIVAGFVKHAHRYGWKPVHYALPLNLVTIVFWPYPVTDRFLLPFLPLFAAGLWLEGKHILKMIAATLASRGAMANKFIAVTVAVLIAAFSCAVAWNYIGGSRRLIEEEARNRSSLITAKRSAYEWLLRSTSPDARVIAYEDASVYLYTGRSSMRPVAFTPAALHEPKLLEQIVAHMGDVPEAIGAQFWMISDDDFGLEWPQATSEARDYEVGLRTALPEVFRSEDGRVGIYSLDCLRRAEKPSCELANLLLLPQGYHDPDP